MIKKAKAKMVKGRKAKKGLKYTCNSCGIVLSVDNTCSCDPCDLICCGEPMRAMVC